MTKARQLPQSACPFRDPSGSELHGPYDAVNRLIDMQRGTLDSTKTAIVGTPSRAQGWDLDALGNMDGVITDSLLESRTHNEQNQLTQMGSATLSFDADGNETTDQTGKTFIYDAWNRPVEQLNGTTSEITYAYDGLNRRIKEGSTRIYFTAGWQEIEDRTAANVTIAQYTWSAVYIDAMVARDRDSDANGTLDERLYVLQDANFNVTGIADAAGVMVERYLLDAYGKRTVVDPDWSADADGLSDVAMQHAHQGGKIDPVTGRINFRNRETDMDQMRWMREDPKGYGDGMNLYQITGNNSANILDPFGLTRLSPAEFGTTSDMIAKYAGFGTDLASRLLIHWAGGSGRTFRLTGDDMSRISSTGEFADQLYDLDELFKSEECRECGSKQVRISKTYRSIKVTYSRPGTRINRSDSADMFYAFHNIYMDVTYVGALTTDARGKQYFQGSRKIEFHDRYQFRNRSGSNWQAVPGDSLSTDDRFYRYQEAGLAKGFAVAGTVWKKYSDSWWCPYDPNFNKTGGPHSRNGPSYYTRSGY